MINISVRKKGSRQLRFLAHNPGLSLREIIHEYKHQTLVLFKCCLLQPKVSRTKRETFADLLKLVDAFLWLPLRETVHVAICFNILDTRSSAEITRLCRPRTRQLRKELGHASVIENK